MKRDEKNMVIKSSSVKMNELLEKLREHKEAQRMRLQVNQSEYLVFHTI